MPQQALVTTTLFITVRFVQSSSKVSLPRR